MYRELRTAVHSLTIIPYMKGMKELLMKFRIQLVVHPSQKKWAAAQSCHTECVALEGLAAFTK